MKKILVVERVTLFSLLPIIYFRLKKSEVYVYDKPVFPYRNWLPRLLFLKNCNFETCINIDSGSVFGREGDSMDEVADEFIDNNVNLAAINLQSFPLFIFFSIEFSIDFLAKSNTFSLELFFNGHI